MNNQELKDMIYSRQFTDAEINEAKSIVNILRQEGFDMVGDFTYKGRRITPRSIGYDGAYRYITAVAIEKDGSYGFDYYIIETGDRNDVIITDFQEKWLPKFETRCQKEWNGCAMPYDCLLYYLLHVKLDSDQRDNAETVSYVLHKRYCLRATVDENSGKYRLEPLHGYGCVMVNDEVAQYGCHFMKPVFSKIECPSCHHTWMFDDSNIPDGEKYEVPYKKCGTLLIRKKV